MAFIVSDHQLGFIDLYLADTVGPGPLVGVGGTPVTYGRFNFPGNEMRAFDSTGQGAGTFVFAKAVGAIAPGTVCEYTQSATSGRYDVAAQAWAGTAGSGKSLCVALTTLATGNWGWFQIEGIAQVTCQGAPVAGNPMYWQASGVVSRRYDRRGFDCGGAGCDDCIGGHQPPLRSAADHLVS
jgi:hypothetical protein